ncbi:MAG: DUF1343 domain-containing protein [Thermodesulfobacteriota bacterium]
MVRTGLENLLENQWQQLAGKRLGLLSNQASTDRNLTHSRDCLLKTFGDQLTCLFSPQHGFFSEKQDNMIESAHLIDPMSGLPLYSLYAESRRPSREMFEKIDVLLIDLVDVGTRVYTFLYTMAYCLEAAKEFGVSVLVLDRPNPIGGMEVEGNILEEQCLSFVGLFPIPMRHGMTFGELALLVNDGFKTGAELEVVEMSGWQRSMAFEECGLPWVFPSPNMPMPATAYVYPGQVIWEGTNISEGRGTTLPFELVGAPFWQHEPILEQLAKNDLPGVCFRPLVFEPTSGKWAGHPCTGFQLHVTDRKHFRPYRTSLALLQAAIVLYPDDFQYKEPPYEYEYERLPMDLILGSQQVRRDVEQGRPISEIEAGWQKELDSFISLRENHLLYRN